jgi:ribosomal-protein-serine acetyltransferase
VSDVESVYAAVAESIPEVSRWLPWCHDGYAQSETAEFVDASMRGWVEGSQFQFGIFSAHDKGYLGGISVNHIVKANRLANVGYWVRTGCTGRGIASAALRLVARYAFADLGLTRLEIAAICDNVRSRRVAERAGAQFEAIARNRLVMHGNAYDAALYSLLPEDL